jgi:hypothetical protein
MGEVCPHLMGKELLVVLAMEGKFASEGLQAIDGDDDMVRAMAREQVENKGIGESADGVWRAWSIAVLDVCVFASRTGESGNSPRGRHGCLNAAADR